MVDLENESIGFDPVMIEVVQFDGLLHFLGRVAIILGWLGRIQQVDWVIVRSVRNMIADILNWGDDWDLESLVDLQISFGNLDDGIDHDFTRINKVRLIERVVPLKTLTDNDRKLSAAENNLRALLIFLKFLKKRDKIIDDLITLVTRLDSIDNALEKILVLFAWGYWLNTSSQQTILEEVGVDAAASAENAAPFRRVWKKNVFVDLIWCDFDHAEKWHMTAAFQDALLESMCGVARTDNEIAVGPS